jgi:hypothetical protein
LKVRQGDGAVARHGLRLHRAGEKRSPALSPPERGAKPRGREGAARMPQIVGERPPGQSAEWGSKGPPNATETSPAGEGVTRPRGRRGFGGPPSGRASQSNTTDCFRQIGRGSKRPPSRPTAGPAQGARATGSRRTDAAMCACTDSALSARAIGGAEVGKLARARSPSAAPTPATRAALIGRTR